MKVPTQNNYPANNPKTYVRNNEVNVYFEGGAVENRVEGIVFQYDKGLVLNIHGVDPAAVTRVCFAKGCDEFAQPVSLNEVTEDSLISVNIPDDKLDTAGILTAYLVYDGEEDTNYRTVKIVTINIKNRKPF